MTVTVNEKLIAYLTLLTGLCISAVAIYYSVVGLTAIFAAAVVPIIIMGAVLEISKLVATVWLKQNWSIAPWTIRLYLLIAIFILMLITSMGIFGFLSKSHSDQGLVSGDVVARIAVYDEKIRISKENIEAARRALKQMDEAVDQVMARSTSETGADKAVALRRSQSKERARLFSEIDIEQKKITQYNEERAPIAAEIRKVEAEVGPLKYIASLIYGETDQSVLERAVVWVIILIVVVFDPLAVVLLLASQISFQNFRERAQVKYPPDDGALTEDQISQIEETVKNVEPKVSENQNMQETQKSVFDLYPYLNKKWVGFGSLEPMVYIEPKLTDEEKKLQQAKQLQEMVKHFGFSSQGDVVKVNGLQYDLKEFETLMSMPTDITVGVENSISQEEYHKTILAKTK